MDTFYFSIIDTGAEPAPPGGSIGSTISYAGGMSPLVGTAIGISHIVESFAGVGIELVCRDCVLNFTTGPFVATVPQEGQPQKYSFSGGGSLQIIGGAKASDESFSIPIGTVLLTAVIIDAFTFIDTGPLPHIMLNFQNGVLSPELRSLFEFPAGALSGHSLIASANATGLDNPPNPFLLKRISSTQFFEPSYVQVTTQENRAEELRKRFGQRT